MDKNNLSRLTIPTTTNESKWSDIVNPKEIYHYCKEQMEDSLFQEEG